GVRIGWGYYFRVGVTLTVPVLLITLAALAIRISIARPERSPRCSNLPVWLAWHNCSMPRTCRVPISPIPAA
ncbi:ArsB/NhaD family transporter, partial [Actinocorallia lasiicapitis]